MEPSLKKKGRASMDNNSAERLELIESALHAAISGGVKKEESTEECRTWCEPCTDTDCNTCLVTCSLFSWNWCEIDLPI